MPTKEYIFKDKDGFVIHKCWSKMSARMASELFAMSKIEYSIEVINLI